MKLVDPLSKAALSVIAPEKLIEPNAQHVYQRVDGIWRMLLPQRERALAQFMQEYETVRLAEGRGSADSAYYRALPYEDLNGTMGDAWRIRAASYDCFCKHVVLALMPDSSLVDLGAGNGWLAARMAAQGFDVAAVDLLVNPLDGLGARHHYADSFMAVQAEFDWLPFDANSADCVLFNASFHYTTRYETTLSEALRVLKPNGYLVILDTPIYTDADSGQQMVREREAHFKQQVGFASNALPSENFLTWQRLEALEQQFGIRWTYHTPRYGFQWALRPLRAKLRGRREPATFRLIVGRQ